MTAQIISEPAFKWVVTVLTGGLAGSWLVYDAISMIRGRRADGRDPLVRDRRFGYVIGMLIGLIGVLGCLRAHDVM